MRETFCFPGYGCPTEIAAVQIKPQWQATQLDDSVRLVGIYHITSHVRFDFQDLQNFMDVEDLVKIDALDIQGDTGYFEYAVPLHVDLPKDAAIEDLMVKDVRPTLANQMCQLEWTVTSIFSEPELVVEKALVLEEPVAPVEVAVHVEKAVPVEQKIVLRESSSHTAVRESSSWDEVPTMIWDLTENYTPLKVRASNDII
ncbi:valyl-tRNA synthetase [Lysinibacillus sphaericus]|uniref:valyl-tRNA synthetase n=1 Tax=Lysinibacillus sphaericus TaxID=1421 RepID=UPI003D08C4DC